jgi:hypothetical protein
MEIREGWRECSGPGGLTTEDTEKERKKERKDERRKERRIDGVSRRKNGVLGG